MRQRHFVAAISVLTFAVAGYGAWQLVKPQSEIGADRGAALDRIYTPPEITSVVERDSRMVIEGTGEPSAIVTVSVNGKRERSVPADASGEWSSEVAVDPASALEISVESFLDDLGLKGDQTVLRVPAPGVEDGIAQRPLILLTSPGGPSRVVQTPFGQPISDGPLELLVMEYDNRGGTVFAGRGEPGSSVNLASPRGRLGTVGVGDDGRWFSVIVEPDASTMREYTLTDTRGRGISVAYSPLPISESTSFAPDHWQVRRDLEGGGSQVAVVFATPVATEEEVEG